MDKFIALTASGIAYGAVLTLVALGFLVLYNATGIVNFANGDLVTLGAYVGIWTTVDLGLPTIPSFLVTLALMAVVGLVLEALAYEPLRNQPALVAVMGTLAAAIILRGVIGIWQGSTPRALPSPVGDAVVHIGGAPIAGHRILIVVVSGIAVCLVGLLFTRTSFGRQLRALADDPTTTRLMGVRVRAAARISFVASAVLAGLGGLLIAPIGAVDLTFGFNLMITAFAAAILGGFGSLRGVVIASFVIGLLQALVGGYFLVGYSSVLGAVLLLAVLAVRPSGLFSMERSRL
ncbi:branched-chain amino acid ABC transporter permease [Nocardioides sp. LMS-CY]|uniref:Branched-chain amino acid transport system permease protein n=1 Tax=Nocardioides soli TaxID=1036020 RepID=A0A7W4VXY0_9ACTN|nr:branched-chain amino acid ABC transporter permease [Nocardioides sp. LMS-CY]MBB3043725.1 branched-chain amino acid transport system permease protein [Nocardioides soli]QWF20786.1 branched-chain amino acid ABC transporter permease [Nocardioides sp. LMS-CY]